MSSSDGRLPSVGDQDDASLSALAIARHVGGELVGEPEIRISGIAPLDRATRAHLSFLASAKYIDAFGASGAGVVFLTPELATVPGSAGARIIVDRPHAALLAVLPLLHPPRVRHEGVDATARIGRGAIVGGRVGFGPHVVVGRGARIGDRVVLGANVVVGDNVSIGDDCEILAGAVLYDGVSLGRRVIVHSGARIGSDGFGYVRTDTSHEKIPQVGRCVIGDDVEIGANTTIDRGSIDDTVIGDGTKIDNLVHIAHNVRVGKRCLILAQAGIAGSARIGDDCTIAGQVGVAGHVAIGRGATIAGQAGVFGDVPPGETWSGYPARPHRESLRASAAMFKLAGMWARLERLLAERK